MSVGGLEGHEEHHLLLSIIFTPALFQHNIRTKHLRPRSYFHKLDEKNSFCKGIYLKQSAMTKQYLKLQVLRGIPYSVNRNTKNYMITFIKV